MPQRPVVSTSTVHEMPLPPGSGSVRVTLVSVPLPVLLTQMPKPMGLPALTLAASASFTTLSAGQSTVVVALAMTTGLFVAFALATFGYAWHDARVVGLVTWTLAPAPL